MKFEDAKAYARQAITVPTLPEVPKWGWTCPSGEHNALEAFREKYKEAMKVGKRISQLDDIRRKRGLDLLKSKELGRKVGELQDYREALYLLGTRLGINSKQPMLEDFGSVGVDHWKARESGDAKVKLT